MEEREIEELKKNPLLLSNESFFSNISDLEDDANFVYPPSQNLYCPICMLLFRNPVITKECGHSFCGLCLNQIENSTCPLCRTKVNLYFFLIFFFLTK